MAAGVLAAGAALAAVVRVAGDAFAAGVFDSFVGAVFGVALSSMGAAFPNGWSFFVTICATESEVVSAGVFATDADFPRAFVAFAPDAPDVGVSALLVTPLILIEITRIFAVFTVHEIAGQDLTS